MSAQKKVFLNHFDKSSVSIFRNQTVVHSPSENATSTIVMPHNHKNTSELLDRSDFKVNSSLRVAESRLFPVGHPDLIPLTSNLVSPFDVATFGRQLLPLLNVNIKEKVKDLAETFHSGADYVEGAIRDSWRESPLNPHNFKHLLDAPNLFKHLPYPPFLKKPAQPQPTSHHKAPPKVKAPKAVEMYSTDGLMHEYGINGYKHFEESILRELERQEELKVEATIHTLFEHGDRQRIQIVQGKPYDLKSGWKPVAAPTKTYDDDSNEVNSQIISPLHTSIFSQESNGYDSSGFHDFDHLNGNSIHSTYSVHEEEGESKHKPVKAKISPGRKFTPSSTTTLHTTSPTENPRLNSRYRKRHNTNVGVKTELNIVVADSGASGSHDAPRVVNKFKRNPQKHVHILSLTTAKPRNHSTTSRIVVTDAPTQQVAADSSIRSSYAVGSEISTRLRPSSASTTTSRPSSTTTSIKPSRNVPREVTKFVDKTKATGYRGKIKFGQSTTQAPF